MAVDFGSAGRESYLTRCLAKPVWKLISQVSTLRKSVVSSAAARSFGDLGRIVTGRFIVAVPSGVSCFAR